MFVPDSAFLMSKYCYFLSEKGEVPLSVVSVKYSKKLALRGRWDHYRIPLPFTEVTFQLCNYGTVSCKRPPKIRGYEELSKCSIIDNSMVDPCFEK